MSNILCFLYVLCPLFSCSIRRVVPFFFTYLPCNQSQCRESNTHWLVFPVFYDESRGNGHCQACQGSATKLLTVCLEKRVINCRLYCCVVFAGCVSVRDVCWGHWVDTGWWWMCTCSWLKPCAYAWKQRIFRVKLWTTKNKQTVGKQIGWIDDHII